MSQSTGPLPAASAAAPNQTKRRAVSCLLLVLLPLIGGLLGYLAVFLLNAGWFRPWTAVEPPPEPAQSILAVYGPEVWVQAESGRIFHRPAADDCRQDCWEAVAEVPTEFPLADGVIQRYDSSCVPPRPLLGAVEVKSDCWFHMWYDRNTAYALRRDGSLLTWSHDSGGEWLALEYLLFIGGGAGLFLVVALIIVLVIWLAGRKRPPFS